MGKEEEAAGSCCYDEAPTEGVEVAPAAVVGVAGAFARVVQ